MTAAAAVTYGRVRRGYTMEIEREGCDASLARFSSWCPASLPAAWQQLGRRGTSELRDATMIQALLALTSPRGLRQR